MTSDRPQGSADKGREGLQGVTKRADRSESKTEIKRARYAMQIPPHPPKLKQFFLTWLYPNISKATVLQCKNAVSGSRKVCRIE